VRVKMLNLLKTITILGTLLFLFCTKVDFNNPLDSNGTAFDKTDADGDGVADILKDDDNDGIPNKYDKDSEDYIKDTIKPVFSTPGNDTVRIAIGTNFEKDLDDFMKSVKANDNIQGDISDLITITSSVSSLVPRVNQVVFSVSDNDGNIASITRYVDVYEPAVKDVVPPNINFGNDTVTLMVGDVYTEIKATAWDAVDGDVPVSFSGTVNTEKAGTYLITYTATDESNNTATKVKTVIVEAGSDVDRIEPEIVLKGKDTMTVATFAEYIEPGFTATDNHDGDITSKVKTDPGQFKAGAVAGLYLIKYSVQDSAGNSTTKIRYVCLNCGSIDVTKPTFTIVGGDSVYSISLKGKTHAVTASDLTDGNLTDSIIRSGTFDSTTAGIYTLTYSVTDEAGNNAVMHVKITVIDGDKDTTKPVITLKGKNPDTVTVDNVGTYTDSGATAKDSGKTIANPVVSGGPVDLKTPGSYTLTYTATDAAGNVATATRTVVVKEISNDLLIKYGVPAATPLASIIATYNTHTIEGTGPALSNVKFMKIDWSLEQQKINDFAMQTTDGIPSYYFSIGSSVQTFATAGKSTLTLASTGISGLDGDYYVTMSGTKMVWVKKDGSYAIVWAP
jgi:hypothetical protein